MAVRIFKGKLVTIFPFSISCASTCNSGHLKRLWYKQTTTNHKCKSTDNKNSKNLSYLCSKHVQWHTCHIAIQFWSSRLNDDAFFNLYQVRVLFMSNDWKIFAGDLPYWTTVRSHVLKWRKNSHTSQWFTCQAWHMEMFFKAFFPKSLSTTNIAEYYRSLELIRGNQKTSWLEVFGR